MKTTDKGDLGVGMVLADLLRKGFKIALPVGENQRYDLIVDTGEALHRVQCKASTPKKGSLPVKTSATSSWNGRTRGTHEYTAADIEVLAAADLTTGTVYYIPANALGDGRREMNLRLEPARNKQTKGIRWASDYLEYP